MSGGFFAFTHVPIEFPIVITDQSVNDGMSFKYPDEEEGYFEACQLNKVEDYYGILYVGGISDMLPKYAYSLTGSFCSGMRPSIGKDLSKVIGITLIMGDGREIKVGALDPYEGAVAMGRFAAMVRHFVKEIGEFWHTAQWVDDINLLNKDNIVIREVDSKRQWYMDGPDPFIFESGVFYKFV